MNKIWRFSLLAGDILWLTVSLFITYAIRLYATKQYFEFGKLLEPFLIVFAIWILVFFIFNLYESESVNPNPKNIGRVVLAMFINFVIGLLFFYLFPGFSLAPKLSLVFVSGISFMLLITWRRFFYTLSKSTFTQNAILVGSSEILKQFKGQIESHPYINESVVIDENTDIENKILMHSKGRRQCLIIVETYPLLLKILPLATKYDCKIITLMSAYESILGKISIDLLTDGEAAEISMKKDRFEYVFMHAFLYRVFAILALVVTSPVVILAMIAIIIESGFPIIYKQDRVGKNGKIFKCYKLRSMIKDAETAGVQWAKHKDARITPVGQILRKTHIDEIPQMWNIIIGDLDLIGPRPERPEFVERLEHDIPYYNLRKIVKPGFTGWAQIKFGYARSVDDSKEKFEYDLYYIKNRNVLFDFGIILKTMQIIVTHL